jgi:hypothetical protein
MDNSDGERNAPPWSGLTGGLVLIAIGLIFLLARMDVFSERALWRLLPWGVLLVMGGLKVLSGGGWRLEKGGLTMILIGAWGLVSSLGVAGLTWGTSWPLLLIGFGLLAVFETVARREAKP